MMMIIYGTKRGMQSESDYKQLLKSNNNVVFKLVGEYTGGYLLIVVYSVHILQILYDKF